VAAQKLRNETMTTLRTYRLWALGFTPSPGPVRLYGVRPQSVITGVLVDYTDENGAEVEVGRFLNETMDAAGELECARAARRAAGRDCLAARPRVGFALEAPEGPGLLAKSEPPMTREYIRSMSMGG
jgi:hypothetical protein